MVNILIPLYAIHLGFNALEVGIAVSAQGFFQVLLRLFGGILADNVGERWVLRFSFSMTIIGGLLLVTDNVSFALLILAQLLSGASRAVYWAASQSYSSRIDPSRSANILGTLSGFVNTATFLGTFGSGLVIVLWNYSFAFGIVAFFGAVALILSLFMPDMPKALSKNRSVKSILLSIPNMLSRKFIYLGAIPSFIAGMSISLLGSVYPVFYHQIGFGEAEIGVISSLRGVGMTLSGFLFGFLLSRMGQKKLYAFAVGGMGVSVLISPYLTSEWAIIPTVTLLGMCAGLGNVLYQNIATNNTLPEERGLALSSMGLFWAIAQFVIPTIFGYFVTKLGFPVSFALGGGALLVVSLFTGVLFRNLHPQEKQAQKSA